MTPNKLPQAIATLLLDRLRDEFNAAFFYKAAENWCRNIGYEKAADYFLKEYEDELLHAQGIQDYLVQWNIVPQLPSIPKPEINFNNLPDIIDQAYVLEYALYGDYNVVSKKAFDIDPSVFDFLSKYRTIQTTSVAEYSDLKNSLALINPQDKFQLFMWEKENFE